MSEYFSFTYPALGPESRQPVKAVMSIDVSQKRFDMLQQPKDQSSSEGDDSQLQESQKNIGETKGSYVEHSKLKIRDDRSLFSKKGVHLYEGIQRLCI